MKFFSFICGFFSSSDGRKRRLLQFGLDTGFGFMNIGKWWHQGEEIDLVGLNRRTGQVILGECKWEKGVDAKRVLNGLVRKSSFFKWKGEKHRHYVVFAKSFRRKLLERTSTVLI